MAQRRKRRKRRSQQPEYPPYVWMLFGLAIGLSVAFAVYIKDRRPSAAATPSAATASQPAPTPASLQNALDDNGETAADSATRAEPPKKRFTFYDILPNVEILTDDVRPEIRADNAPRAIEEPGVYLLQAGSFSTHEDADRRRAELALHGIESHIQRVKLDDRNYHRVYIGPTDDLVELNMLRSRLRAAHIDVFRIRLSD